MKYIYLDQNKWIELARGIKEKKENYIVLYNTCLLYTSDAADE